MENWMYGNDFLMTQEGVWINKGKRAIHVQAIEFSLYILQSMSDFHGSKSVCAYRVR